MGSIAVTRSRLEIESSTQTVLPVELGGREVAFDARAYQGKDENAQALALLSPSSSRDKVGGDARGSDAVATVRLHSGCVTGDIFHSLRCDCYQQLQAALAEVVAAPRGVLIYLPYQEGRGIGLVNKIRAYAKQDQGLDTVDANLEIGEPIDARDYGFSAAILSDLGISKVRLLTNNPAKVEALRAEGIDVVEQVPLRAKPSVHNKAYLDTKRKRMDHKI